MPDSSPDWSMGAVLLALGIFGAKMIYPVASSGIERIRKGRQRVLVLKWSQVPDGKVHDCLMGSAAFSQWSCSHLGIHRKELRCWESDSSLAVILNRAWRLSERRPSYFKDLPAQVPPSCDFICTDLRTILACVLCTAPDRKSSSWNPRSLSFGTTQVSREIVGNLPFYHFQGQFQRRRGELTKSDLEKLLNGYPPWYRDRFTTRAGSVNLSFPIHGEADVSRGGWIIAVGLMDPDVQTQTPLAVYRCLQGSEPEEPQFRSNGVVFRAAIARCRDHIVKNIQPHFPADVNVAAAVTMLQHLIVEKTGSGIPSPGEFGERWSDGTPPPHLTGPDCRFVMRDFNRFKSLDGTDVARYRPILLPAMAAVVHGAYEVVQYLKDVGVELKLPPGCEDLDSEVFLKDCVTMLC